VEGNDIESFNNLLLLLLFLLVSYTYTPPTTHRCNLLHETKATHLLLQSAVHFLWIIMVSVLTR
jgi:hypothetical protein